MTAMIDDIKVCVCHQVYKPITSVADLDSTNSSWQAITQQARNDGLPRLKSCLFHHSLKRVAI
jgi:hypothetical protein